MGVAKILLDAIERCECEMSRIDAILNTDVSADQRELLQKEKDNYNVTKEYLQKPLHVEKSDTHPLS